MKKFLVAVLILSLSLCLFACGWMVLHLFNSGSAEAAQAISSYLKSNGFATKEIHKDLEDRMRAYRWNGQEQEWDVSLNDYGDGP